MTYQIPPSRQKKLKHKDYVIMLQNVNENSVICNLIRIRKEKDNKKIREFSECEKKVYWEWVDFKNQEYLKENNKTKREMIDSQMMMFIS